MRKYVDCREFPSEMKCTVVIAADSEEELLEAAAHHAVTCHRHKDGADLRAALRKTFRDGTPPA